MIFFSAHVLGVGYVVFIVIARAISPELVASWFEFTRGAIDPIADYFSYTNRFTAQLNEFGFQNRLTFTRHVMSVALISVVAALPYYVLMLPRYAFRECYSLIRYGMGQKRKRYLLRYYIERPLLLLIVPIVIWGYKIDPHTPAYRYLWNSDIHAHDIAAILDAVLIHLLPLIFFKFVAAEYGLLRTYIRYRSLRLRCSIPRRIKGRKGIADA